VAGEVNGEVGNGEQRVGHGGNYGWLFGVDLVRKNVKYAGTCGTLFSKSLPI
jgi:hypothetical protein